MSLFRSRYRRGALALAGATALALPIAAAGSASAAPSPSVSRSSAATSAQVDASTAAAVLAGLHLSRAQLDQLRYASLQLLSINDFHGNLQPPTGSGGRALDDAGVSQDAGGAAYLATHMKKLSADRKQRYSVRVAAGDLIGASPLVSALFHDEPTIEFMNQLGIFASSTGNHEYDEGITELQRMQHGGCNPTDGCFGGDGFAGAGFTYLSANVTDDEGKLVMPAYAVKQLEPAFKLGRTQILPPLRVGFIGLPLKDTPTIVTASGVAGLHFGDEVTATNRAVKELQKRGVKSIVLLVHQGDNVTPGALPNACGDIPGPSRAIAEQVSSEVDVVFSGHSHQAYNCVVNDPKGHPRPFVQGSSFGRYITEVDVKIDRLNQDVARPASTAYNHLVTRDVTPDPAAQKLVDRYVALSAPIANRQIGTITTDLGRNGGVTGEEPLGDVIADAQLWSTSAADKGGAVAALMNPGGIRADLTYASSPVGEGDGVVTYAEAFTVQPFTNYLTTLTLTGAQIDAVLEQQWDNGGVGMSKILQVSDGFHYTWNPAAPVGSRVDPASISINGTTVDPAAPYRITVNNFLAGGGDNFTVLRDGTDPLVGPIDVDSFVDYLGTHSPISPPALDRISVTP